MVCVPRVKKKDVIDLALLSLIIICSDPRPTCFQSQRHPATHQYMLTLRSLHHSHNDFILINELNGSS